MVLVPEDVLNRFEQKQKLETAPIVNNMLQKDIEMSGILYRKDLSDDEKQKLYHILTPLAQRNFFKRSERSICRVISYETKIDGSKLKLRR